MSMVLTIMPGMTSQASEAEGETEAAVSELQDENSQRLEELTAMDEDGSIYEIEDKDGTVTEVMGVSRTAQFAARSSSPQVVNFNTKGNAVTTYTDETNGISGYTNGAYGADAAYLGTTSDGRIRFMLSGVTGTVSASEVQLVDYSSVAENVSYYTVSGGKLIHYISQDLNVIPTSAVNNGFAPSYLSEGGKYYSYDGHYFYTDYGMMLSDYQSGSNGASAVNAGNRFSNYFQFLDMNLSTNYSGEELDGILSAAMENAGINPASSKLTGTGNSFVEHQNTYSVNALLSLGIAINESAWGRSSICLTKNNIFGLNAVDSSPNDAYAFASIDDCIREFMNYQMANAYLKDGQWSNHGEYLGNKGGGINVSYASDPYWGEKAAAHAWNLDTIGGNRDYPETDSTPGTPSDDSVTETPGTGNTPSDEPLTGTSENGGTPANEPTADVPVAGAPDTDSALSGDSAAGTSDTDSALSGDSAAGTPDTDSALSGDSAAGAPDTDSTLSDEPATETPDTGNIQTDVPAEVTPDTEGELTNIPTANFPAENTQLEGTAPVSVQTAASGESQSTENTGNTQNAGSTQSTSSTQNANSAVTASPKTGDSANAMLLIAMLTGSAFMLIIVASAGVKKRSGR